MAKFEVTFEGKQGQALVKTVDAGNEADAVDQLERDLGREVEVIAVEEFGRDDVLDLMLRTRERIKDRDHWCRPSVAELKDGTVVPAEYPNAYRWCVYGAITKEYGETLSNNSITANAAINLLDQAGFELFGQASIIGVNDDLGHAEVMQCLDLAIERRGS